MLFGGVSVVAEHMEVRLEIIDWRTALEDNIPFFGLACR